MRRSLTLLVAGIAASQLGATDCGDVLKDPGFDLWCGSNLCAWTVERGEVTHAPTWNTADWGAELVGDDVAIEQMSPVTSDDTSCLVISMVADIASDAEVDLNLDAYGDGTVDYTQRIPTSSWAPISYTIAIGGVFEGMRFEIAKHGSGHAELARLRVQTSTDCAGFAPSFTSPAPPVGGDCTALSACAPGASCVSLGAPSIVPDSVCVGCGSDADCGSGDVCGLGAPVSQTLMIPTECVPAAQTPLGELCSTGEQCETGVCAAGVCSTCAADADCGSSGTCGPGWTTTAFAPHVCNPGAHAAASGAPCASDGDCASGTCNGTAGAQCLDGRSCTSSYDCPFDDSSADDSALENGPCIPAGDIGGTCL